MRVDSSSPLLASKLYIPPPRAALVARPRLLARLGQGLELPLTLISAPAGSGKTTLLSEWRASPEGAGYPLAWLALDEEDNDPRRFLTYLAAALEPLKPGLAGPAFSLLQSARPPQPETFLAGLIQDLEEVRDSFALVLDDYHQISTPAVHEALDFLLEHHPQAMHLVLLTRSDPPLPLARLRARNQLAEIRSADLRFTREEAGRFFQEVMGLALSPSGVEALEQRTEGWAAGLQLAGLALQGPRSGHESGPRSGHGSGPRSGQEGEDPAAWIESFSGSHRYIADYLSAEVLNRQPENLRSFLLQTSILDRMTAGLCDHLTGRSDSQAVLQEIEEANLFVLPLDEERLWFRYHPLFAELLRSQLRQLAPEQLPVLHSRAAEWLEQHGYVSSAIRHALEGGDLECAAGWVERHALSRLERGDAVTVMNWIEAVAPLIAERPWLGIYQSLGLIIKGETGLIEDRLQTAESWIAARPNEPEAEEMQAYIAAIRALLAERSKTPQRAISLARQALDRLPERQPLMRSLVTFVLGDACWSTGDLSEAMRAFRQVGRMEGVEGGYLPVLLAQSSVGMLLVELGSLHQAEDTFHSVLKMTTQPNGRLLPAAAVACLGLGGLAYEWNELETCDRFARQALEFGQRLGNPDTLANTYLLQARLRQALGDTEQALDLLRQAETLAQGPGVTPWSGLRIDAFRVQIRLAAGQVETAMGWARERAIDPGDQIYYPSQAAYLALARILAARQQGDLALPLLKRLQERYETLGLRGRLIELLLVRAVLLHAQGDTAGALANLGLALDTGEPEGYLRTFLDEGEAVALLLRHAASRGIHPRYVARLLAAFNQAALSVPGRPPESETGQPLLEPLSPRELEVLRLLERGLSNQDIAAEMVVALGTVKAHTASLYRKLGVIRRTQAVARARELGLL